MMINTRGVTFSLWLNILFTLGFVFGDVHSGFDISTVTRNGGCQVEPILNINQVSRVESAFTEMMQMVALIQDGIANIQAGTEAPAVGWMFNSLFGIQATEELLDRQIARPQAQRDALAAVNNLMTLIVRHSQGNVLIADTANVARRSRIFCNKKWVIPTEFLINPATGFRHIPLWPMPNGQPPGQLFYYDIQANIYLPPPTTLLHPDELVCGANNAGFTSQDSNVITFCPVQFGRPTTIASSQAPFPAALPPDLLGTFHSMSMTFLHEYTHLVGKPVLGTPVNPIPDVTLFPEAYAFPAANALVTTSGTGAALRNADSYALLGVALLLNNCDWRDGSCRSAAFWASERQQQLAAAGALTLLQGGGLQKHDLTIAKVL